MQTEDAVEVDGDRPGEAIDAVSRIREIHQLHASSVMRYLMALNNGQHHLSEDLLQDTMLRAWRSIDSVPAEHDSARRWLITVARRAAIDAARTRNCRPREVYLPDGDNTVAVDDPTGIVLATQSLRLAFSELSPAHRTILTEFYSKGSTIDEVANRLGLPAGTVKSRAHYAMRLLRAAIESTD